MGLLGKRKAKDTPSKTTPSSKKVKVSEADSSDGERTSFERGDFSCQFSFNKCRVVAKTLWSVVIF